MVYHSRTTDRPSGALVEAHSGSDPRLWLFHIVIFLVLLALAIGLAYQQLIRTDQYREKETVQNQRRVIVPGPRGNIYDRDGQLLVGNRPRFSITLSLDELRAEFRREYLRIRRNYDETDDEELPTASQLERIARASVVQRHLMVVNRILGTSHRVDAAALERHYRRERILPFILVGDLTPEQHARLLEQLPVRSPLQLYTSSIRHYPHGALAAHVLGYTASADSIEAPEGLRGAELTTFYMRGWIGQNGLEQFFDERLQGRSGGAIYRVDPAGYRIQPPLEKRAPVQGDDIHISIDIDLQRAADAELSSLRLAGAAVAIEVATGEVLALVSKPDYDLNAFHPRLLSTVSADIEARGAWLNRATQGFYAPGSTFKLVTALAGLRSGTIPADASSDCQGTYRVGGRTFVCNNHRDRGPVDLAGALEKSCNVFFYEYGLRTGIEAIAAEARRYGLDRPTGLEIPYETRRMNVPDPAWKQRVEGDRWFPGDTANVSIGQGSLALTPLQMACFTASLARGEVQTRPTLLHRLEAPRLHTESDGLTSAQRAQILAGMEAVTRTGTGRVLQTTRFRMPDVRLAGKTGTAQQRTPQGTINFAWFVGFAPADDPKIAVAVMVEGDTPGEDLGGGRYAAPVAGALFKAWADKGTRALLTNASANP